MIVLRRAQINKKKGLDVTIKSAVGFAKSLAPTWQMVMDHKSRKITDDEYKAKYYMMLDRAVLRGVIQSLSEFSKRSNGEIIFLCYCGDSSFCHTHILIDWLILNYPDLFVDGRNKAQGVIF